MKTWKGRLLVGADERGHTGLGRMLLVQDGGSGEAHATVRILLWEIRYAQQMPIVAKEATQTYLALRWFME